MRITLFSSVRDTSPHEEDWPWTAIAAELTTHTPLAAKDRGELFSPATFTGPRADANVDAIHFAVLDFDHLSPKADAEVRAALVTSGYEHVRYTSWSHGANGEAAYRVVLPLTRPVPAEDWGHLWPALAAVLGAGHADPACRNPSRFYYLPSHPAAPARPPEAVHVPGRPVDPDRLLLAPPTALQTADALAFAPPPPGQERLTHDHLVPLIKRLASRKDPSLGLAFRALQRGEAFADAGARDSTIYKMTGDLAKAYPQATPESVAELFSTSLTLMGPDAPTPEQVADKFQRHLQKLHTLEAQRTHEELSARQARISQAIPGRTTTYTADEVRDFGITSQEWVLQRGQNFWFFCDGQYVGPFTSHDATAAAQTYLAPAVCQAAGVTLDLVDDNGRSKSLTAHELVMDHGTVLTGVEADLRAQRSWYDRDRKVLVEAPCPLAPLTPEYSPTVDAWLEKLGGNTLRRWLSLATDLDRPCAALFLEGPPGTGKSLLANGVARLWGRPPTAMDQAMGGFNQALTQCPLIFADETTPKDFRGQARTAEIRELIQARTRPLKRKYQNDSTLIGACRVVLAANNRMLLNGEGELTMEDVRAITDRILHVWTRPAAALYLQENPGMVQHWVETDAIARHALYLRDTMPPLINPPRFLVQTESTSLVASIAVGTKSASAVCHWLASWAVHPTIIRAQAAEDSLAHLVHVHRGRIRVSARALMAYWDKFEPPMSSRLIAQGLRSVSIGQVRPFLKLPCQRTLMWEINTQYLKEWLSITGYYSVEELDSALEGLAGPDFKAYYAGVEEMHE